MFLGPFPHLLPAAQDVKDDDVTELTLTPRSPWDRFESVIVGKSSGKRNFPDRKQLIHESRIPHEINHASHAFRYSRITFLFK